MSDDPSILRDRVHEIVRRRQPDPMTRRLMLTAGGLSVALVVIVALWSSTGRPPGPVPVVQADPKPFRVKPANPGGMVVLGLGVDLGQADGLSSADRLAPAPETPDPQALANQVRPDATPSGPTALVTPPTGSTPASTTPIARTPIRATSTGTTSAGTASTGVTPTVTAPTGTAQAGTAQAGTTSTGTTQAGTTPTTTKPAAVVPPRPVTVAAVPPAQPASPASPTAVQPVTAAPLSSGPAAGAAEQRAPAPAASAPMGRTQVQLAAVTTEAAARREWERLTHRMPDLLGTHQPVFSQTERDGHTLWRVRTGDFPSAAEASQFCQQVRAKGGGCAVATF
jgi:hypothetical protein